MIFRNFINLGLLSITVFLTSCSSTSYQIPGAKNPEVFLKPLERDEYEVLGDVEERGCASKYWIILPLPWVAWSYSETNGVGWVFNDLNELAIADAMNQINAIAEYDSIIAPRTILESRSIPPFYWGVCATIRAKGVSIDNAVNQAAPMGVAEPKEE